MVRDRPKHFFLKRLGSRSLYIAAPKVGRAEVPAGSTGGEGAVGRPSLMRPRSFSVSQIIQVTSRAPPLVRGMHCFKRTNLH